MNVRFNEAADRELAEAAVYYEGERAGLGEEFVEAVEAAAAAIVAAPRRWPSVWQRVRRYRLDRFPYGVIHRVRRHEIEVLAVMHLSRDPGYWKDRT